MMRWNGISRCLLVFTVCVPVMAQDAGVRVCIADESGARLAGALVAGSATGSDGCARVAAASAVTSASVTAAGFVFVSSQIAASGEVDVVMRPSYEQQVTVTASRGALDVGATASSVRVLSYQQLQQTPAFTLDDQMKTVPGFQLYRRSSSWVSNPTSQGVSLRGLGSTAASRTLVVSDQVPFNDPFGGWVHWDEIPQMAVHSVSVLRGGGSDLYGSSAIGGVVDVQPEMAGHSEETKRFSATLDGSGANEGTSLFDGLLKGGAGAYDALAAATTFRTAGFIQTAPSMRGSVDENANVHDQSGRVELRRSGSVGNSLFLRGNMLNEARNNGTPDTTNGTRIWRYVGGGDVATQRAGRGFLRLYGTDEDYRQSFSSIAADRNSEKLTKLQRAPVQEMGASAQWAKEFRGRFTAAVGADVHDVRATDNESAGRTIW